MSQHLLFCYFKQNSKEDINLLRERHRKYISENHSVISFGGFIKEQNQNPASLFIAFKTTNRNLVKEFVKNDPYFPIYQCYTIKEFELKISNEEKKTL